MSFLSAETCPRSAGGSAFAYIFEIPMKPTTLHRRTFSVHSSLSDLHGPLNLKALLSLKKNKNLIIKPADKGGATVVWRRDLYVSEAEKQLSDQTAYTELPMDPTSEIQTLVKKTLATLVSQKHLPESAKALLHPCPQISNFYLLPKIHKANNPGRPIVSSHSCPTVLISQYVDSVLSPLVSTLPSFIQDTLHFLRLIQNFEFPENPSERTLFTMDVSSLYTSIPHHAALAAIRHYLDQRQDPNIPTTTFLRLTELVLTQNCFQFNGRLWPASPWATLKSRCSLDTPGSSPYFIKGTLTILLGSQWVLETIWKSSLTLLKRTARF
ncbi:hypothetical protein HOLleu_25198 [Holothuria leucospilota]|uniref:Reverse transcriptase domain-containing protein n=1 Tax=Holothuria leucospilota TaxID=206669 RepID=A0A9Q1H3U3_HOLLE|nr:hypothetical protein HOLleu_25198 [Holothuria leucospilota]